ncbi:MAG: uracil-DNA glycosylase [Polyangiaceae bacterium]|nr:uracil-DNA glycosylase [Polyangiaceae bacterium]
MHGRTRCRALAGARRALTDSGVTATRPLRSELCDLVAAVRAYVEWQGVLGTTGFPRLGRGGGAVPAVDSAAVERRVASVPVSEPGGESRSDPAPLPPSPPRPAVAEPTGSRAEPGTGTATTPVVFPGAAPVVAAASEARSPSGAGREQSETAARDGEAVRSRLAVLQREVAACTACRLHLGRHHSVFARGMGTSGICFVGEGPGAEEDAQGVPFVGAAGQLLDRMIAGMGLRRDEVYICNIVKCRPPENRRPQPDEMAACRQFLEQQLELIDPEVMVALGATAVQGLFDTTEGITRIRGRWRLYRGRIAVMPTFHPAYVLRTPAARRDVWNDLKEVLRHVGREIPGRSP